MMDELKPCPFCGSVARGLSNGKVVCDNDGCGFNFAMYGKFWNTRPIEDALQKRVEELNGEVKKWQDICTLSDDRAIVCIGNERALRTSLNEAVKEIEAKAYEKNTAFANRIQFMLVLDILRRNGLMEDK
jgi:hypothetical protein